MTKIINDYPPNYTDIEAILQSGNNAVFAYSNIIYNPHAKHVDKYCIAHEKVHFRQQKKIGDVDVWWDQYLSDVNFRVDQEVEAYRAQYRLAKRLNPTKQETNRWYAEQLAKSLSGETYGNCISFDEALKRITS